MGVNWEPARTIGSYLWYKAYVSLTPSTCFILDDGAGCAVGYIIGTPDTASFSQRWRSVFTPIVDPKLVPKPELQTNDALMEREDVKGFRRAVYEGECSMIQGKPEVLGRFPAHFHVDILPEWQGRGWGGLMVDRFCQHVKGTGVNGVHLGMVRTNDGARRFYGRLGFQLCDEVLDGGASGERGRHGDAICLVKSI